MRDITVDDVIRVLGYTAAVLTDSLKPGSAVREDWWDYGRHANWDEGSAGLALRVVNKAYALLINDKFVEAAELIAAFDFRDDDGERDVLCDISGFSGDPCKVIKRFTVAAAQQLEDSRISAEDDSEEEERSRIFQEKYPDLVK